MRVPFYYREECIGLIESLAQAMLAAEKGRNLDYCQGVLDLTQAMLKFYGVRLDRFSIELRETLENRHVIVFVERHLADRDR